MSKLPAFIITDGTGPGVLYLGQQVGAGPEIDWDKATVTLDQVAEDTERTKHRISIYRLDQLEMASKEYWFRAYSSRSGGFNSIGLFKSQAAKNGRTLNVESLTEAQMADQLRRHVNRTVFESHLISFTVSFMWAFHRALALREAGHEHVRIAIIDSWDIPKRTWVRHGHSMLKGYGIERELMLENLGQGELFVWDQLRVPMDGVRLDDMLKAGVLTLLPFYRKPDCDLLSSSPAKHPKRKPKQLSKWKKPYVIRNQIFKHLTDVRAFVRKINEEMAPKTFREKHVAGCSFYKKKLSVWWLQNSYIPLSHQQRDAFVTFVEALFSAKYQFPMLITLFSLRLDDIEHVDIIDCMDTLRDHPMMSEVKQCFKGKFRRGSKELDSFEWLLEQCADRLGVPCRIFQEWHQPRFTMPRAQHLHTMLPFLTWRARKNFESRLKQELERKRGVQINQGVERQTGRGTKQTIATSPKCAIPFIVTGKRKADIELDRAAVKKSRSIRADDASVNAFVQNIANKMGTVDI
ncbi:hypothetical protein LTR84_000347 [Exophiala bonariae]|uniref:DUF7587 domain-containing protein n=1 Tax=Exophiala bonariae TaxID=1690606 RepID=A0AAV9NQ96_9EURO|nr:hypothetical protein LTR84_000347 [Exophiala bonariae]